MLDINNVCEKYPYKSGSIWTESQQHAWERQGKKYIPTTEEVNGFCKRSGYK